MVLVGAAGDRAMSGVSEQSTVVDEAVASALARAAIYRLLGAAFAYPTAPRIRDVATAAAGPGAGTPVVGPREALAAFARAAADADADTVAAEYTLLFDRQAPCAPCEGAYGDAPQMAGKSAALADIAGFYDAFGFGIGGGQFETEDHVIAELEFMSALALKEAWALAEGESDGLAITRDAQAAFLREHLACWAGAFAQALIAATPLPYYVTAAALLEKWVCADAATLGVAPSPVGGHRPADPLQDDTFTCPLGEPEGESPES
jgi:DMSO reductase family type II enzyme chaperone